MKLKIAAVNFFSLPVLCVAVSPMPMICTKQGDAAQHITNFLERGAPSQCGRLLLQGRPLEKYTIQFYSENLKILQNSIDPQQLRYFQLQFGVAPRKREPSIAK